MKLFFLSFSLLLTVVLVVLFGHIGDVIYYLNVRDGSLRNGLMSLYLSPFFLLSDRVSFLILLYASILWLFLAYMRKYFSLKFYVYIFVYFLFFFIPSKESLSLVLLMFSSKFLLSKAKSLFWIGHFFLALVVVIRPFLLLFYLYWLSPKFFLFSLTMYAIYILTLGNSLDFIDFLYGYMTNYFSYAEDAGSTDFVFLRYFEENEISFYDFPLLIVRSILPVWMLTVNSFFKLYYFFMYCLALFSALKFFHLGTSKKLIFFLLFLPFLPIVITNAGSAARYISILPLFVGVLFLSDTRSI
jgi:hypothetical protein